MGVGHDYRALPATDGWSRTFSVESTALSYSVWSGGKDGGALAFVGGATKSFNDSIVFSSGAFVQWPEGAQTN